MLILVNITLYYFFFFLLLCEVHIQEKIVYNQTAYPTKTKKSTSLKTLQKQVD